MSGLVGRARTWRVLILLAVVAVLAVTLVAGPVFARSTSAKVAAASTYTRFASCAGLDFLPNQDGDTYTNDGGLRYRSGGDGEPQGYFQCDPHLPNGAVVNKVAFMVQDYVSIDEGVNGCGLVRAGLTPVTYGSLKFLAGPLGTTGAPGAVQLVDTSIHNAHIDNSKYGYFLQCQLLGIDHYVGIWGAFVRYTISSTDG